MYTHARIGVWWAYAVIILHRERERVIGRPRERDKQRKFMQRERGRDNAATI